ncbi:hypothetical protein PQR66_30780 [Paraburkholderia agricolaris]|uniref:Uncharacterized protein n=1 Tax=Paraburkholderia agricolaris TaxID=2152888 RepID=A0ABW8ZW34_9BURK
MPAKHVNRKRLQRNMRKACVELALDEGSANQANQVKVTLAQDQVRRTVRICM